MLATKNVATVLVGSVLVLAASFALATPAKADMLSDLQAQVQALLAQIAALSGGSTAGAGAGCHAFTMTHQMGDTGGEVMWIQQFLNGHGAVVAASGAGSPGNESSYFGALTRAAVAKWQAANGVSPAAGYWGPVTRAKVASVCAGSVGTTPGTTPGSAGLQGTAGTVSITTTSEDVEDEILTGQTEKIVGMKVEAQGSDVRVTNIRVRFDKDSSQAASSDVLTAYFSEVSIWANGQKIGSMPASSFTRDSAGVYSASIPVDQIVRMGSSNEVKFHVGATAVSAIDSDDDTSSNDWTVDVTQVRYTDASGAVLFENPEATIQNGDVGGSGVYITRTSSATDVKLRMSEGSGNPKSGNVKVSTSNTSLVTLAEFTLKAENADMYFDSLIASTTLTGVDTINDMVQTFFLMRGSTQIAEEAAISTANTTWQELSFTLDDTEEIAAGSTQTYRIVAKVNAITTGSSATVFDAGGDTITASTSPAVYNINARATADGKSITERAGSITTYTQTLYSEGIQVTKVGESFQQTTSSTAADAVGEFKITLRVTNFGSNDVYIPLGAHATTTGAATTTTGVGGNGVAFLIADSTDIASTTNIGASVVRVSGGTTVTNSVKISGGQSTDLQLTITFNPGVQYSGAQQYRVLIGGVGHAATDVATATSYVFTTPKEDFRTSFYTINN